MTHLPPLIGPLRYLIGGDDTAQDISEVITELSYDADHGETRYGTLTDEKGRFKNWTDANKHGHYAPYLQPNDITDKYGEYMPNPLGSGFIDNVRRQCLRAVFLNAKRIELDNPDYNGLGIHALLLAHDVAWGMGLRTVAKNPLLTSDPKRYLSHPSIDLAIVEHGAGGSDQMDTLRKSINQPLLAVRFVAFIDGDEDGSVWAHAIVREILAKQYFNMGVTISRDGEYTSVHDLVHPFMSSADAVS